MFRPFALFPFLLALLSLFVPTANATQTVKMGNSTGNSVTYEAVGNTDTAGVALFYPASTMQAYKGCRITQLRLQLDTKTATDALCIFISRSLDGTPDYEQRLTGDRTTLTVTLDSAYVITGEAVYIGYTVKGAHYLLYSKKLVDGEEWIMRKGEGWQRYTNDFSATLTATVEGDSLPCDVRLTEEYIPEYALTKSGVSMSGSFVNLGPEMVKNLTVKYFVDDKEQGEETVSGFYVTSRKTGTFNLSALRIANEGTPRVRFEITAVNGEADGIPTDNVSREENILVRDSFQRRTTLLEVFSTEGCTNCPTAHELIASEIGIRTDVIELCHHSGFYTDTLTVASSIDYEWFYKPSLLYAPAVMFDRTCWDKNLPSVYSDGVPVITPDKNNFGTLYRLFAAVPAYASVNMSKTYDDASRQLSLHVEGNQLLPLSSPDSVRLFVALTEDSIYSTTQRGASSGFYHRHALRMMVTPTWGDKIDVAQGYSADYTVTLPTEWNAQKMRAVAFVANYNSQDKNDCRVYNAAKIDIVDAATEAIHQIAAPSERPTLSGGVITCRGMRFDAYDILGRRLAKDTLSLDTNALSSGVYIIKVGTATHKISL